jgi:superfamily II DNA/RNA helicase
MNATAVGLDFSCASHVVFAEVPDTCDVLLQAEGRAHRFSSRSAVNVYILVCKRSRDVRTWCRLSDSLEKQASVLERPVVDAGFAFRIL